MQCRNCGIEIADKALICYKCGAATTEATHQPLATSRSASSRLGLVVSVVLLVLLVALAVYTSSSTDGEISMFLPWAAVALAVAIVARRAWARRR
jgi:hypothetical protein